MKKVGLGYWLVGHKKGVLSRPRWDGGSRNARMNGRGTSHVLRNYRHPAGQASVLIPYSRPLLLSIPSPQMKCQSLPHDALWGIPFPSPQFHQIPPPYQLPALVCSMTRTLPRHAAASRGELNLDASLCRRCCFHSWPRAAWMSMFSVCHVWPVPGPTTDGRAGLTGLLGILAETGLALAVLEDEETSCLFCPGGKQRERERMRTESMECTSAKRWPNGINGMRKQRLTNQAVRLDRCPARVWAGKNRILWQAQATFKEKGGRGRRSRAREKA